MPASSNARFQIDAVKEYYAKTLRTNKDLKTTSCCNTESIPQRLRSIVAAIHPDVQKKFYGCGVPIPLELKGKVVLDLGCGSGRDCFVLSKLVGEQGRVIGIDMTTEQLDVAREHTSYHMMQFGYKNANVDFRQGYMEDLKSLDIADASVDVVVSNCVFNLSPNKEALYREIFRVLKPGGELYFSDVFSDRRLGDALTKDPVLLGECLGGAQYIEDFRRMLLSVGCPDYRVINRSEISMTDSDITLKVGNARFFSLTVRAFKLAIEDRCEDYGQIAYYLGTIAESPHEFVLDDHHTLEKNRPLAVCSNTAAMLGQTRFAPHFKIVGDTSTHFGLFDCAPPAASTAENSAACC